MDVAFCILTKDHCDILLESSVVYFQEMAERNIDIYIYDSSEDTKTKSLALAWNAKGFANVYWVDCRFTETGDEKVLLVYEGFGLQKRYDYIWMTKDRIALAGTYLDRLLRAMEDKPDVVITGREEDSYFWEIPAFADVYTDPVSLFRDFGATTTSWESVIFRFDTMLEGIDWDRYAREYGTGPHNPFNQPVVLFARLAEVKEPRIVIERPASREKVFHTGAGSGWLPKIADLWGKQWPEAIGRLPSLYDAYKEHVIKVETMHPNIFASTDLLMRICRAGYLDADKFALIRDDFEKFSDIPAEYVDDILRGDLDTLAGNVMRDLSQALREEKYFRAMWLHNTNAWMAERFGKDRYDALGRLFERYQRQMRETGYSDVLTGIHGWEDVPTDGSGQSG